MNKYFEFATAHTSTMLFVDAGWGWIAVAVAAFAVLLWRAI